MKMTDKERTAHIRETAEDYGIDYADALMIYDVMGDSESHDGFITMVQDFAESQGEY